MLAELKALMKAERKEDPKADLTADCWEPWKADERDKLMVEMMAAQ